MCMKISIDNKRTVFNYLRSKKFGKDALSRDEATEVLKDETMCNFLYLHIEQLKEVYNGKYSSTK